MSRAGLLLMILLWPTAGSADVHVDWVEETAGVALALDASDAVYTVHYVYNPGGDIVLTKRAADGTLLWERSYDQTDPTRWERASWVATDPAGNVVVCGTSMSGYSNPVEAASVLMKFDPQGALLWRRVYESSFDGSSARQCLIDEAGDIYVLGIGSGPPGYVTKVRRFAPDGTPGWVYYDAVGIGAPVNMKFTPDGALLLVGRGIYGSVNGYAKIGRDGRAIWSRGGILSLTVGDAAGDAAGNTYIVHQDYAAGSGTAVAKLDPAGATLWSRTHPLSGFRVEVGSDQCPVVCGFPNAGSGGASFVKLDPAGALRWANPDADGPLGLLLHARLIVDRQDAVYLAAGTLFEMAVCKVSSEGASEWTLTMPRSYANGIALASDGDVFVVGGATARIDQVAPALAGGPEGLPAGGLSLSGGWPNPAGPAVTLGFSLPAAGHARLSVYDVTGRHVATLVDGERPAGPQRVRLVTSALPNGVYLCRLEHGASIRTRRFTVLNP